MMSFYNEFDRLVQMPRQFLIDDMLPYNLQQRWDDPSALYGAILQAFQDDVYTQHIQEAAEHLHQIDYRPDRGATVNGIYYMNMGQLDQAERVLTEYMDKYGQEDVAILTSLTKVHSHRDDEDKAQEVLEQALAVDPNFKNGFEWYLARARNRDGSDTEALLAITRHEKSWRAQIKLAWQSFKSDLYLLSRKPWSHDRSDRRRRADGD